MEPINWHSFFFLLFGALTAVFAVAVVVTSNIVRMAFYLILSLGATAGLFFLAGADFVGAMQLMIYVGGTLVLLIFGVMLTAQGPFISMKTGGGEWVLATILGGALLGLLVKTAFSVEDWQGPAAVAHVEGEAEHAVMLPAQSPTSAPIGLGLLGVRTDKLDPAKSALAPGMAGYLLPFEIVSVHLLVVLVGAAYLARTKKRREA
ncbi:MAG: NADH-quinone oxidoreductase subunit J [Planctomycetia bacterium]|nr:NADH-quinone oxidoreductase subunit J [Planctomycetia bacterium]